MALSKKSFTFFFKLNYLFETFMKTIFSYYSKVIQILNTIQVKKNLFCFKNFFNINFLFDLFCNFFFTKYSKLSVKSYTFF